MGYFKPMIWKAWCIRKRHYVRTLLEFVTPLLCCAVVLYLKSQFSSGDSPSNLHPAVVPPVLSKKDLFFMPLHGYTKINFVFAPNTTETNVIMDYVKKQFLNMTIDEFTGFSTEKEMVKYVQNKFENTSSFYFLFYGIVFENIPNDKSSNYVYTIRSINNRAWHTDSKFPPLQMPGPMESGAAYINEGFTALQIAINDAFLLLKSQTPPNFSMQEFPYPEYEQSQNFVDLITSIIPTLLIVGYSYTVLNLVPRVMEEKESGCREWMRMVGLNNITLWSSWLLFSMMLYFISTIIICIMLLYDFGNGPVLVSPTYFLWILFFLFCTNGIMFALALSTLFRNATMASVITILLWIAPNFIISQFHKSHNFPFIWKFISCFLPSMSVQWAFVAISGYEASRETITFSKLFVMHTGEVVDMTLGVIIICQIIFIIFYSLLLLYLDAVKPGKYGRARPWFFLVQGVLNKFSKNKAPNVMPQSQKVNKNFEVIADVPVGLNLSNIHKKFGKFTAVDNVSLDIYKGQITALLGHNGAGKTTLINILTGMYSPTGGAVFKDGKNIFEDFGKFQQKLGLCPQENLLFPYLSVAEHVIFFGVMRGMSNADANKACKYFLQLFGIENKAADLPVKLSGGMKRKLCLAVSLVGSPEIIILDEPTSGMDPESRRETWNKLLSLRGDHIILLTTHFMEEADVLGDIIAIMDQGSVKCYGSSLFLKKHFGEGYELKVSYTRDEDVITSIVQDIIPDAVRKSATGSVLLYSLPPKHVSHFSKLFEKLENSELVTSISVACTTMEDVFLRVDQIKSSDETDNIMTEPLLGDTDDQIHGSREALTPRPLTGFNLFCSRLTALIIKKLLYSYRTWSSNLFFLVLWPFLLLFFATYTTTQFLSEQSSYPTLKLELSMYGDTKVLLSGKSNNVFIKTYTNEVKNAGSVTELLSSPNVTKGLLEEATSNEAYYRSSMIVAADFLSPISNLLYSSIAYHGPPITVNLFYSALLNAMNYSGDIITYNHPFDVNSDECRTDMIILAIIPGFFWIFFFPHSMASVTTSFCKLHHDERLSSGKLLQFMTGTSPIIYWVSAFICDFLIFLLSTGIMILTIWIFDSSHIFYTSWDYSVLFIITVVAGICGIWFGYFLSFFMKSFSAIFSVQIYLCIFLGEIACLVINILKDLVHLSDAAENVVLVIYYILMCYPGFATSSAIFKLLNSLSLAYFSRKCDKPFDVTNIFNWSSSVGSVPGINTEITFLLCSALFWAVIVIASDFGLFEKMFNNLNGLIIGNIENFVSLEDEDVSKEKQNIKNAISNRDMGSKMSVIVNGLGKKYSKSVTAVKDVSFMVAKGECFGLLGVNGAGKSTTFKMLTGDIIPSKGDSVVHGYDLNRNKLKYQSHIGYCPQSNAIIEKLSAVEILRLYAALRGVSPSILHHTISAWISQFDLQKICNKFSGTYSGGNKRKLCTAVALIGDPQVILLDEPTTGVDPVARRKFWNILSHIQKKGQTVIITSHSMDECEKVCDRLTIMAEGEMKCIGNIQHLKEKFGQGFIIMIKLGTHTSTELAEIKTSVQNQFYPHCILRDEHIGLLHYHINSTDYQWSVLFSKLENIKQKLSAVEDYIITETTLEQIFLFFAKQTNQESV